MIVIDGSHGEGGGQVLRTSLALSLVTGQPFRIEKIRAGRSKPGLRRQHLTAVTAAAEIGCARVDGACLGSQLLEFYPHSVRAGTYHFDIGTAGSCTLVLQTILPPLLAAVSPSKLLLEGGTHNPGAPPFDFLYHSFLPLIRRMGPHVSATLLRTGFYPAGGGKISVAIDPSSRLEVFHLQERGDIVECWARAVVAQLPRSIAERELAVVRETLDWDEACCEAVDEPSSPGPGNIITLGIASENVTDVFTGFGERGVRAEWVAETAVREAYGYLAAGVPVGVYLADQLLVPMALAGGGSFRTLAPTRHFMTNADVIRRFLPVEISVKQVSENDWDVRVHSS